jgi:Rod binding domain-containing protein
MNGSPAVTSGVGLTPASWDRLSQSAPKTFDTNPAWASDELREKFNAFVAGTFFKSMLEAMRKTVGKNPLIHGGRAEEIFRSQLDNTLVERIADQSGDGFSNKMFEQFLRQQAGRIDGQASKDGTRTSDLPQRPYDVGRTPPPGETGRIADHTL